MEQEGQYTTSSVEKALKILKLFDGAYRSMTLTEISERVDMRKETVVGVLAALEEEGFVGYGGISECYSLGMSIYMLSNNTFQFISVVETAKPYLEKVTTELNLIAHPFVLEGEKIMLIDRVVPNANAVVFGLNSKVSSEVEVHNTGTGKVLVAYSAAEVREKTVSYCSFESYSERTVTDKGKYRRALDVVKKSGYATNEGESEPYLKCIIYSIFGYGGKIEATPSLSGTIQYLGAELKQKCHETLKGIYEKIFAAMGQSL